MADVTQIALVTADEKRKARVIDFLERLLAEAKEGSGFETFLFVATRPDSDRVGSGWTGVGATIDVVGRLEKLKHDLLYDMAEREDEGPPPRSS